MEEALKAIAAFPDMQLMYDLLAKSGKLTKNTELLPPYIVMARVAVDALEKK